MDILENMRKMLEAGKISKEDIERAFPELKESEDERIRKWLVDYFKAVGKSWIHRDISPEQILTYLEKQKDQKPAEWSEEDLQHKSWILECLADGKRTMPQYAADFHAAYNWLKSLRPQPHWKPSEEQMEVLQNEIKCCYACGTHERAKQLETIYDDLKKL